MQGQPIKPSHQLRALELSSRALDRSEVQRHYSMKLRLEERAEVVGAERMRKFHEAKKAEVAPSGLQPPPGVPALGTRLDEQLLIDRSGNHNRPAAAAAAGNWARDTLSELGINKDERKKISAAMTMPKMTEDMDTRDVLDGVTRKLAELGDDTDGGRGGRLKERCVNLSFLGVNDM